VVHRINQKIFIKISGPDLPDFNLTLRNHPLVIECGESGEYVQFPRQLISPAGVPSGTRLARTLFGKRSRA
jgi:hypothetical protein